MAAMDISKLAARNIGRLRRAELAAPEPSSQSDLDSRLLVSAMVGRPEGVAKWIAAGADPMCRDEAGYTPLMCAALSGSVDCIDMLLPISHLGMVDKAGKDAQELAGFSPNPMAASLSIRRFARSLAEREEILDECSPPLPRQPSRMGL